MEKQWVRRTFDSFDSLDYMNLDDMERMVKSARESQAKGLWRNFLTEYHDGEYEDDNRYLAMTAERLETDEELKARETVTKRNEEALLKFERQDYERLKKKFEQS